MTSISVAVSLSVSAAIQISFPSLHSKSTCGKRDTFTIVHIWKNRRQSQWRRCHPLVENFDVYNYTCILYFYENEEAL